MRFITKQYLPVHVQVRKSKNVNNHSYESRLSCHQEQNIFSRRVQPSTDINSVINTESIKNKYLISNILMSSS